MIERRRYIIQGIYKITCLADQKVYIGLSSDIEKRFKTHLSKLRHNHHVNAHLQGAWNKYGENNFTFEILELCDNQDQLKSKEIEYISLYNSTNHKYGYNITPGGDGVMDNSNHEVGEKKSISTSRRPVVCFDKNGILVKRYRNATKASLDVGASSDSNIWGCCEKRYGYKTAMGYYWMYEDDYLKNGFNIQKYQPKPLGVKVAQYDLNGNYIHTYKNMHEAARITGIGFRMISRVCNGERPHTHGFIWKKVYE